MALKGHKPACKCVGCSAATRKRGMSSLGIGGSRAKVAASVPNRKRRKTRKHKNTRGRDKATFAYADSKAHKRRMEKLRRRAAITQKKAKGRMLNRKAKNRPVVRRRRNPADAGGFIGRAPSLSVSRYGDFQFPSGTLFATSDPHVVRLFAGVGAKVPPEGSKVTRIEYDDPVKAVEAYKEIGRFRHDCSDPFVVGQAQGGNVLLTSKSTAWRRE